MHLRVLKQTPVPHIMIYLPMLPKNSDEIFVILKHIFNISLERGVFPDKLDKARETPIFKKGKKQLKIGGTVFFFLVSPMQNKCFNSSLLMSKKKRQMVLECFKLYLNRGIF